MRYLFIFPIVLSIGRITVAQAVPATNPADSAAREKAAPWIARAEKEMATIPDAAPAGMGLLSGFELAMSLNEVSPTDAHRELALQILRRNLDAYLKQADAKGELQTGLFSWAFEFARLGDLQTAREMQTRAEAVGPPKKGNIFIEGIEQMTRLELYAALGEYNRIEPLHADGSELIDSAQLLDSFGYHDAAEKLVPLAHNQVVIEDETNKWIYVTELARMGDLPAAQSATADFFDSPRPDADRLDRLESLRHSIDAHILLATAFSDANDHAGYMANVSVAINDIAADPYTGNESGWKVLQLCISSNDADNFSKAAKTFADAAARQNGAYAAIDHAELAEGYAAMHDAENYRHYLDLAKAGLKNIHDDPSMGSDFVKSAYAAIGAAEARGGEPLAALDDWLAEVKKLGLSDWEIYDYRIADACADAGRYTDAMAIAILGLQYKGSSAVFRPEGS
jgi:hypothetical protein